MSTEHRHPEPDHVPTLSRADLEAAYRRLFADFIAMQYAAVGAVTRHKDSPRG